MFDFPTSRRRFSHPVLRLLLAYLVLTSALPVPAVRAVVRTKSEAPAVVTLQGGPTLGNYGNTTVQLGANATITPDAAPTNTTRLTVATSTNFKGLLA